MNIEEEIFQVYNQLKKVQNNVGTGQGDLENYTRQIFNLKVKLQKLEKDLYLHRSPDLESDEIDLYISNFHDTFEEEPDRFNLLESEKHFGNIGAKIEEEYRGMRYSKKAFILLRDVMLEHNLRKPIFTVRKDNISSIKSLDSIGAKRVEYIDGDEPYYVYDYDLESDGGLKK